MQANIKEIAKTDSLRLTNDFFKRIIIQSDIPGAITDEEGIIHYNIIDFLLHDDLITPVNACYDLKKAVSV